MQHAVAQANESEDIHRVPSAPKSAAASASVSQSAPSAPESAGGLCALCSVLCVRVCVNLRHLRQNLLAASVLCVCVRVRVNLRHLRQNLLAASVLCALCSVSVSVSICAICARICWRPLCLCLCSASVSVSICAICARICWRPLCSASASVLQSPPAGTAHTCVVRTETGTIPGTGTTTWGVVSPAPLAWPAPCRPHASPGPGIRRIYGCAVAAQTRGSGRFPGLALPGQRRSGAAPFRSAARA